MISNSAAKVQILLFSPKLSAYELYFDVGGGIEPLLPSVKDLISIRIPRDEWKNIQQSTCAPTCL